MKVEIFYSETCPYCQRAKMLLESKGVEIHVIDVNLDPSQWQVLKERSGGRETVPQIFIGDHHVGGCDDLYALENAGGLDALLGESRII